MKPIQRLRKVASGICLAAMLAASSSMSAFAAVESGVTVTGGSLSGATVTFGNFGGITMDGTQRTSTATWAISNVVDARGTGAGWKLSLALTQLKEYDTVGSAYVASGKVLATSSVKVTTASVLSQADTTSSPTNTITPVTVDSAIDTGSAVQLLTAALDGGMGSFAVGSLGTTLTIPANAFAKTYKTDATVSLSTGP